MTNKEASDELRIRLEFMRQHPPAHEACKTGHNRHCEALEIAIIALRSHGDDWAGNVASEALTEICK